MRFSLLIFGFALVFPISVEAYSFHHFSRYRAPNSQTSYHRIGRQVRQRTLSPRRQQASSNAVVSHVTNPSIFSVRTSAGRTQVIRLLGVDAPEFVGSRCFTGEASWRLAERIVGEPVTIVRNKDYQRDSYRRLVRYVDHRGQDLGRWLISNGLAFADRDHSHRKLNEYIELERDARIDRRGLFGPQCEHDEIPFELVPIP